MPELVSACSTFGDEWSEIGDLLELIRRRPAWHADAACREAPPEVSWFIDRGEDPGPAKAVRQRCLVADECRAWALDQGADLEGVWAGMSKADRRAVRRGGSVNTTGGQAQLVRGPTAPVSCLGSGRAS